MRNTNTIGMLVGLIMMLGGFIGLVWKSIESVIYRFQNPDFTEIRIIMENPQLAIWAVVFGIICVAGEEVAKHNTNAWRKNKK